MRRHPPPDPGPGPVMANPLASDYERFLPHRPPVRRSGTRGTNAGPSSGASHSSSRPAAPPSQGTRAGGGIITSNQANIAARRAERESRAQFRASSGFRRHRVPRRATAGENMHFVGMFRADSFDPFDPISFNQLIRYGPDFMLGAHRKPEEPHYLPSYTHPETADPGFSFDFDPSSRSQEQPKPKAPLTSLENPIVLDDDGEIVEEPKPLLDDSPPQMSFVCSNCSDPLVLGEGASASALEMAAAGASAELVEAERKGRRLWGLRCGHLIDGKCLEALAYPPGALDAAKKDVKGKGKTRASDTPNDESDTEDDDSSESFFTNPIRSRLRSATNAAAASAANGSPLSSPDSLRSSIARRYLPNPVAQLFGAKPKPRSKPKKLKVEETYIWSCPVVKCSKAHTSVKMGGEWGPEKDKGEGAIAMFI
ncbi:hypothetical protein BDP27DRAFT_1320189 [Rhodocollybia butyracea]|uniref:Uncharacterized protein n=1 Tax=Rhodocollybia butyracea TaxID=206335 RepID=A0A9P5UB04_9AGAR|nr:hypothetical protein BDP27DRAFT_1320189 [Rhodocollybia butyracea]